MQIDNSLFSLYRRLWFMLSFWACLEVEPDRPSLAGFGPLILWMAALNFLHNQVGKMQTKAFGVSWCEILHSRENWVRIRHSGGEWSQTSASISSFSESCYMKSLWICCLMPEKVVLKMYFFAHWLLEGDIQGTERQNS